MSENGSAGEEPRADEPRADAPRRRGADRRTGRLITQRAALGVGFIALLVGAAFGAAGDRLLGGGPDASRDRQLTGSTEIQGAPAGALRIAGRTTRVDAGDQLSGRDEAITLTIVRQGVVEVTEGGRRRPVGSGDLVVEAPGADTTLRVREDAILDVIEITP